MALVDDLRAEEVRLATQLGAVRKLLSFYKGDSTKRGRPPSIDGARILDEAEALIRDGAGELVTTAYILERLTALGVSVSGKRPVNTLSAILSSSGRFVANGRRGWTLQRGR